VCVYPIYLDSSKTVAQGRRIPKERAAEKPNCIEVFETVKLMGFDAELEIRRSYPRDFFNRGRIRVKLFEDDHKPVRPEISSRKVLFTQVAVNIPKYREKHPRKETAPAQAKSTASKSSKKGKKRK